MGGGAEMEKVMEKAMIFQHGAHGSLGTSAANTSSVVIYNENEGEINATLTV